MADFHKVPDAWRPRLDAYLRSQGRERGGRLSTSDFQSNQSVHLQFVDGSYALFRYAFALFNESDTHCMVFTEHCGYHIFPIGSDGVETVRTFADPSQQKT